MRLLFVHQNFGAFGGAETNIQITADELLQRGLLETDILDAISVARERATQCYRLSAGFICSGHHLFPHFA